MDNILKVLIIGLFYIVALYSLPAIYKWIKSCLKSIINNIFKTIGKFIINSFNEKLEIFLFVMSVCEFAIIKLIAIFGMYIIGKWIVYIFILSLIIFKLCQFIFKLYQKLKPKKDKNSNEYDEHKINLKEELENVIEKGVTGKDISNLVEYMNEVSPDEIIENLKAISIPGLKKLKYILKKDMENKKRELYSIGIIFSPLILLLFGKITYKDISVVPNFDNFNIKTIFEKVEEMVGNDVITMSIAGICIVPAILWYETYSMANNQKIKVKTDFYIKIIDEIIDERKKLQLMKK